MSLRVLFCYFSIYIYREPRDSLNTFVNNCNHGEIDNRAFYLFFSFLNGTDMRLVCVYVITVKFEHIFHILTNITTTVDENETTKGIHRSLIPLSLFSFLFFKFQEKYRQTCVYFSIYLFCIVFVLGLNSAIQ